MNELNNKISLLAKKDPFVRNLITKGNMGSIVFRINNNCNMSCSYCYQHLDNNSYDIKPENFNKLKKHLNSFFKRRKTLEDRYTSVQFVGGEISEYKYLKELFELVIKYEKYEPINYRFITNGLKISDDIIFLLKKFKDKIFTLDVSLDTEKYHNLCRVDKQGSKTFFKILENVKEYNKYIPVERALTISNKQIKDCDFDSFKEDLEENYKHFSLTKIKIDYTLGDLNKEEKVFFKKIYNYAKEINIKSLKETKKSPLKLIYCDLECISYSTFYIDRNYCIANKNTGLTFVAKNDEFILSTCNKYIESLEKYNDKLKYTRYDNVYSQMLYESIKNSQCKNCKLKAFCLQTCFIFDKNLNCQITNKYLAELAYENMQGLISIPDFYNLLKNYKKIFGEEKEYESYLNNEVEWKERIKEVYGVDLK